MQLECALVSLRLPLSQPECYYWAAIELGQRSILTGWLILLPAERVFLRLVAALLISLAVLVWTMTSRPYRNASGSQTFAAQPCDLELLTLRFNHRVEIARIYAPADWDRISLVAGRTEDNILATSSILLLNLAYTGGLLVKTFEDFSATDHHLAQRVLGFSSTDSIVSVMLAFTVMMLLVLTAAAVHTLRSEERMTILMLKETRQPPKLSLVRGQRWMLFNSHIWSTGQDQAREFQRCVHGHGCVHVHVCVLALVLCMRSARLSPLLLVFLSSAARPATPDLLHLICRT